MTSSIRLCLLALAITAMLPIEDTVRACIPLGGVEPPCSAYWRADVVFAGAITEISDAPREPNEIFNHLLLHFAVQDPYRGVEAAEVEVAAITGTECDTKFQKGEKWLIYAHRNSPAGRFEVSARTKRYSAADEDLAYIRGLSENPAESTIIARVFEYPDTPLQGIRIEIEGSGIRYHPRTDKEGQITVPGLALGRYAIRGSFEAPVFTSPTVPSRVEEHGKYTLVEYEEDIRAGRCAYIEFFDAKRKPTRDR